MIDCIHAREREDRVDSVVCNLGLFGGRPSFGTCDSCLDRKPDPNYVPPPPVPFPKPKNRIAPKLAKLAARNLEVCLGCNHHNGHTDITVSCNLCGCNTLPLFATAKCPAGKWAEAEGADQSPKALSYYRPRQTGQTLNGIYSGSAFLICGGPSLKNLDLDRIKAPGLLTMAINNSGQPFRPDLFVCVDHPGRFLYSIWRDPNITKFAPANFKTKTLFNSATEMEAKITVEGCPNVWFYQHRNTFHWWKFFSDDLVNWGNSTMMIAIRILYDLGIRRIFLLGADFHMTTSQAYAHGETASRSHAANNNRSFRQMQRRFGVLAPLMEAHGLYIYNLNPYSRLTAFPFLGYNRAVSVALEEFDADPAHEKRSGLYHRGLENDANLGQHSEARPADAPTGGPAERGHLLDAALH